MDSGIIYACFTPHPPILVPSVGGRRSSGVARTRQAMGRVAREIRALDPDVMVLISPHAPIQRHAMGVSLAERYAGDFGAFGAPGVRLAIEGDTQLGAAIVAACHDRQVPTTVICPSGTHQLDHGAAVPLYFIGEAGVRCPLVLLSFSGLPVEPHQGFGRAIADAAARVGKRTVLVASGDLSHRLFPGAPAGYSPMGTLFDHALESALRTGDRTAVLEMEDRVREEAGECGYRSLVVALAALPGARSEVLSYEGPFGVGYLVARFAVEVAAAQTTEASGATPADPEATAAVGLAKEAVETFVRRGRVISAPQRPEGLLAGRAGVFVCLKIDGELRGCMGTSQPSEASVAQEIIRSAVAAASRDPRFEPVTPEELPRLTYSVDVLSAPESVLDETMLDPKRYGVIVQAGSRRGLLLPDLEEVQTVRQQLEIARRKAGIGSRETVKIWRFTVRRLCE